MSRASCPGSSPASSPQSALTTTSITWYACWTRRCARRRCRCLLLGGYLYLGNYWAGNCRVIRKRSSEVSSFGSVLPTWELFARTLDTTFK